MSTSSTYYIDTDSFATATAVWIDADLTTKAPDGFYSFGGDYRQQDGGLLDPIESCSVVPTGYKIRSFTSGQNIYNDPCLGDEQWFTSEFYITIQLVEEDGITPKINTTGSNIVVTLQYEETGCSSGFFTREAVIEPGESEVVAVNKTGVAACPECINTSEIIQCYVSITPSGITPTEEFFPVCPV